MKRPKEGLLPPDCHSNAPAGRSRAQSKRRDAMNLDAMEISATVPTSQDAGSYAQLMTFLNERLDNLENNLANKFERKLEKLEASTEAILKNMNVLEGRFNDMMAPRAPRRAPPARYACCPSNAKRNAPEDNFVSVSSQKDHNKEASLRRIVNDLLKAGNPKYKTRVLFWTDSDTRIEIDSADTIPDPILSTATVDCSVATALRCCGIDDAEASARTESSENPFTVFAEESRVGEDQRQSNLQVEWNQSSSCPLSAACDGRKSGKLPMFLPGGAPNSFDLTGEPDIVSRACPMVMEFTLAAADRELKGGLTQVLQRLHVLLGVNCFIKRSFGFAVNGGASSFLVSVHRHLVHDQPHWYEDTVHILKIATTHVAGIWNELTRQAQEDLCFVLDRDVFALAATLRAMSAMAPQPASPPPPPDWDLSRLMGYTKINLQGLSSSRVYGVYPSSVITESNRNFIRTTATEPVFLVKINDSSERSCREHSALKQLAESFGASPWAQLFYVHQSFVFENWVVSETAIFSTVAMAGHFPTMGSLLSLGITDDNKLADLCLDAPGALQETPWWNPLVNRLLPDDTSRVATVVMKKAHRLEFVNDDALTMVNECLQQWLQKIHKAGVLHTDLRSSNIMWLPVESGNVTKEYEDDLALPVDDVLGGAESAHEEARVDPSLASQFNMVLCIEDRPSVAGARSHDGAVVTSSETTDGTNAIGRPEATATTEADETTDATANDAIGATAATATAHSVARQKLMLPIVIDFDCAELLSEGADRCNVDISIPGARSDMIRRMKRLSEQKPSAEWTTSDDMRMKLEALRKLVPKSTK